ncbi:MAG: hypothetical protein EAZ15_00205 [Sphingobacteriales bacterium]|nr:MAG: hypothetical protein EAZ15_00205 [Sphingobacteriales bacterium]
MIKEIKSTEWAKLVASGSYPVFFDPKYLDAVIEAFGVKVAYFIYEEKNEELFLAAVFIKNHKVIKPDDFTYNPYYLKPTLSERKQIAIQNKFIELLKSNFKSIDIKFNVDVLDIRPFKWAGFKIDIRYTYIKNTSEPSHINIKKNIKKAEKQNIRICVNTPTENCFIMATQFLKNLGYDNNLIIYYKNYFNSLTNNSLLVNFEIYKSDDLIGSALCLLDKTSLKAYTLLSNPLSNENSYAHTMLYQTRIHWLRDNNFIEVDFCGANYETISYFKSYFNPKLMPYYVVKYKKSNFGFLLSTKVYLKKIYNTLFK